MTMPAWLPTLRLLLTCCHPQVWYRSRSRGPIQEHPPSANRRDVRYSSCLLESSQKEERVQEVDQPSRHGRGPRS